MPSIERWRRVSGAGRSKGPICRGLGAYRNRGRGGGRGQAGSKTSTSPLTFVGGYVNSYQNNASAKNIPLTSLTGGIAAAPTAGDIVVCFSCPTRGVDFTGPWMTSPAGNTVELDAYSPNLIVEWFIHAGETQVVTSSAGNNTTSAHYAILVFRGGNPADPFYDLTASVVAQAAAASPNPPSITLADIGVIIGAGIYSQNPAVPAPAAFTDGAADWDGFFSTFGTESSIEGVLGVGYKFAAAGAFDPAAFTGGPYNGTGSLWAAATMALKDFV